MLGLDKRNGCGNGEATALVIYCGRKESMISELTVISSKRETAVGNFSASVSQEES